MKIGLDYFSTLGRGGNSVYAKNLIRALAKIDRENRYYLYYYLHTFLRSRRDGDLAGKNFKLMPVCFSRLGLSISDRLIRFINQASLKIFTRLNRVDIFHFTNPLNFINGFKRAVVTIHDLAPLHNSQWVKKSSFDFFKKNIRNVLNQAKMVLASSYFTKDDIIKFFNIPEEKIRVVHLAAGNEFRPDLDENYLKEKFDLKKYILYLGELQPRKNIIRLLVAYSGLNNELRDRYNLVIVGLARDKNFANKMDRTINSLKINKQVRRLGYVEETALPKLYSGARVFVYPSLLEGFGLPILESLSCGTPVVASKTSSLPEVVGQAGILFEPEDVNEIKLVLERSLTDEAVYQNIKGKCLEQASKFSWEKTAKEVLVVYQEVYEK